MLCFPPDQRVCTLWALLYCIDGVVSKIVVCCVSLQIRECARCGYYYTVLMVLYQRLWCVVFPSRSESVHVVGTTILYLWCCIKDCGVMCVPPDQRVCTLWALLYCIDGVVSKIVVCCVCLQIRECARCGYYYTVLMVLYQRLWCVVCPSRSESVHVVGTTILY